MSAFALAAIAGGLLATRTPPSRGTVFAVRARQQAAASRYPVEPHDAFADDPAVVAPVPEGLSGGRSRVALVLVECGRSLASEAPFILLDVPMTVVVDAHAPAAHEIADLATRAGDDVYLQLDARNVADAHRLHAAFPGAEGFAARVASESQAVAMLHAAKSENLAFLDEYAGDPSVAEGFAAKGVRYAARSLTIDDRSQRAYVQYMFAQAIRIGRSRTAVTIARPLPATLHALTGALASSEDPVRFVRLP